MLFNIINLSDICIYIIILKHRNENYKIIHSKNFIVRNKYQFSYLIR